MPTPPTQPFVFRPEFPNCVHPGVQAECESDWCRIPAGCYVLGSPEGEVGRARFTEEFAEVTLTHDFEIQETPLTLAQWRETGWPDPNRPMGGGTANPEIIPACSDERCPVDSATWFTALEYANWLSETRGFEPCVKISDCARINEGVGSGEYCSVELLAPSVYECSGYRLPTSAEWEYAARAGTTTAFYSGEITSFEHDDWCNWDPNLVRIGWYCANVPELREQPVKQLLPNAWGLYDVVGNIDQWTMDHASGLAVPTPSLDPGSELVLGGSGQRRGCSINGVHGHCRSAAGLGAPRDSYAAGIRLVRTLSVGTLPTLAHAPDGESPSPSGAE